MRVMVIAPIDNSLYSLLVTHLCLFEPGVEVSGIMVRSILNFRRFKSEFRRDGTRLLRKIWRKLVLDASQSASSNPDSIEALAERVGLKFGSVSRMARSRGIPVRKVSDLNDVHAVAFTQQVSPDLVLFTGGGLIREQVFRAAGLGVFNVHMGILPAYRGMDVVEWPILEGRCEDIGTGITLHLMDRGVDTGPIVASHKIPIVKGDNLERLRARFPAPMVELMLEGVRMARDGRLKLASQLKEDGRQYYVMHPRLREVAENKLMVAAEPPFPG